MRARTGGYVLTPARAKRVLILEQRARAASGSPDVATALILEAAMLEPMQQIADLTAVLGDALDVSPGE